MKNSHSYKDDKQKLSPQEKEEMFEYILKRVRNWRRRKWLYLYLPVSAVACMAMLVLYLKFFYPVQITSREDALLCVADSIVNEDDIRLILANNETITFDKDADIRYDNEEEITVDTGGEQIRASKAANELLVLNTLVVPNGKRSSLTLADGSKVWVNSGSTLKFPSQFTASKREIWVEGEVYIDVVQNKKQPFCVNTSKMMIDVVGTQFNISAYNEDADQTVVLVKGSVDVSVEKRKTSLSPNQMLSVSAHHFTVKEVDVSSYVSWKDGYLQFTSEPLSNILKRLSRYYNISIHCDENCSDLKCNGKLILFDKIDDVLQTISNTIPIKYLLEGNQVTVLRNQL